jgi:REP element-mobilizing transposase RayT
MRIQVAGATYHVNAHAISNAALFRDGVDRQRFLDLLERTVSSHEWSCYAYCLMGTHYHLVVHTPEANIGIGMKWLNGAYAQGFNRRHGTRGHVFESRYDSRYIEREPHLLEALRYVVNNPVAAGLCDDAAGWSWSSYRAWIGMAPCPRFLSAGWVLAQFGTEVQRARERLRAFVDAGIARAAA